MQQVSGATVFGKIARVFDELVPWADELTIEEKRRFPGQVPRAGLSRPIQQQHSSSRPAFGKLLRPRQLHSGVVRVARFAICPGREGHKRDQRCVESALRVSDLVLDSQRQIPEPRSQ